MQTVTKEEFAQFVRSTQIQGNPVSGTYISVMQYVKDGLLLAQAIYRRGCNPVYQLRK